MQARSLLGFLLVAVAACARAPEASSTPQGSGAASGLAWRAITADAVALDRKPAFLDEKIQRWDLPKPEPDVDFSGNPPLAEIALDLAADEIQVVSAEVDNLPAGTLALWWRTAAEDYAPASSIQVQMERSPAPKGVARFEVVDNPHWRGKILGLRLYTEQRKRAVVRARALEILRRVARTEEFEKLFGRPWKLALGRDLRNGYLLPPGRPVRFEADVPDVPDASDVSDVSKAAELDFSWGLEGGLRDAFEIVVEIAGLDGEPRSATSHIAAMPAGDEPRWHDASVDLRPWRGRRVGITLASRSAAPFDPSRGFPLLANPRILTPRSRSTPWNVVLISIDTLRADHLSCYGYGRETTPRLDAWARRKAALFENVIAAAPSTLPSHASMFTGVEAFRHGAQHDPLALSWRTLAEELRAAGYATWGVTGGGYTSPAMGLSQGFDIYRSWVWGFERGKELSTNMDWTLEKLSRRPAEPFLLFFHTYEVHAPLRAREPAFSTWNRQDRRDSLLWVEAPTQDPDSGYRSQHAAHFEYRASDPSAPSEGSGTVQAAIDRYDSSIAYVDAQLDRLFQELERTGLAANTLVVVTSDHGESFGEHGLAGHGYLYDDNLRVPLLVAVPGARGGGERVLHQVRSIDITPTILDLAIGSSIPQADGSSLRPLLANPAANFPDHAWSYAANSGFGLALRMQGRLKYWLSDTALHSSTPVETVFDLRSDPAEAKAVALADTSLAALRSRALDELARHGSGLHLKVENLSPDSARITLRAAWIGPLRVTSTVLPAPGGRWNDDQSFTLSIATGARAELNLQGTARLPLEMAIERDPGPRPPALHVESPVDGAVTYSLLGGAWESGAREGALFRVTARNVGATQTPEPVTARAESELESQLRALGYIQ